MSEGSHPFGAPLDPSLLVEPPAPPKRPLPVGALVAMLLPAASFAGASLLQNALEGPLAGGDAIGRWLELASLVGVPLGIVAGLALARGAKRLLWIFWGALSPVILAALVLGGVRAVHPVREVLSERAAAKCRLTRRVCSVNELRKVCGEAGAGARGRERVEELLGPPRQSLCTDGTCTHRWLYTGPWTPDNWVAPGSLICSVVVDAQGISQRSAIGPGPEVP